jgi:phenylacetate-CoA ligase
VSTPRVEQARLLLGLRRLLAARRRLDRGDDSARAAWRAAQLTALRRHAAERSPWYRDAHRGLDDAPLEDLPVLTKADVVDRFDDIVTDRGLRSEHLRAAVDGDDVVRVNGRYRVAMSSGSSGRPGLFPFDPREWVHLLAGAARGRSLAGTTGAGGSPRSAKVGSPSPWHLSRQLAGTLQDPRKPSLELSATRDVPDLVRELRAWRPEVLTGYASVLGALAAAQLDGDLDISPTQVLSGGEVLTPAVRAAVREAWGVEPHDQYLTTEAGFVAVECPAHAGLHVLEDHVVVEVVDDDGRPVEPGELGTRALLTVLSSRTVPLIRYQLDDVLATAPGPCDCGRTTARIGTIVGTPRDLLELPGSAGGTVAVHPVAFTAVLDSAPVRAWQVAHGPAGLTVRVVDPAPSFEPTRVIEAVTGALTAAGACTPEVEVAVVDSIDRTASGKAALLVNERPGPGAVTC